VSSFFEITAIFGGIGGLELGLHRHGHRTSLFCERDPEAQAVLAHHFPDVPIADDIAKTDAVASQITQTSNLLTAGFPCTDLSQAGRTQGFAGGRSSLIRETIELLRRRPFPNVLIENVPNWRHLHRGAYMTEVLSALELLGYKWAYRTIDALAFGIPQRRHRVFVFASLEGDPREVLFHGNESAVQTELALDQGAHGFYWTEGNRGLGWGEDCIPTLKGGSAIGIPAPPAILMPSLEIVTPDLRDAERLQGLPQEWTDLDGLIDSGGRRFNRRRRWHLVGNAVNVEVSSWIGEQLAVRRAYEGDEGMRLEAGESWPSAAWSDGQQRYRVAVSTWPVRRTHQPLARFLEFAGVPLSVRATAGFFDRIGRSRLHFKPGFREAVGAHLKRMESRSQMASAVKSEQRVARPRARAA